jgi:hypothetical protein
MPDAERKWNPRYVAYARAHGDDPETRLAKDRDEWPGGCMVGFSFWIHDRWRDFARHLGIDCKQPSGGFWRVDIIVHNHVHGDVDHAFDEWLGGQSCQN